MITRPEPFMDRCVHGLRRSGGSQIVRMRSIKSRQRPVAPQTVSVQVVLASRVENGLVWTHLFSLEERLSPDVPYDRGSTRVLPDIVV